MPQQDLAMKIICGVASSTHLDAHGHIMTKHALTRMASAIRTKYLPLLVNHDWRDQVGVVLCARVEKADDGEFVLLVVAGIFENNDEAARYQIGEPNIVWRDFEGDLDGIEPGQLSGDDPSSGALAQHDEVAVRLATYLDLAFSRRTRSGYITKFLVASVDDLIINVYRDHPPPHFHVISRQRNIDVRFHLETLDPLEDSISSRDVKKIKKFFEANPDALQRLRSAHSRMQA